MTYKLCYVSKNWAYFTTLEDLSKQWGDDWNDIPFEYNAGEPYYWREDMLERGIKPYKILRIAFYCSDLSEPCEGFCNSSYSVDDINKKKVPWLQNFDWLKHVVGIGSKPPMDKEKSIWAGESLSEFCQKVKNLNGEVFLPLFKFGGE